MLISFAPSLRPSHAVVLLLVAHGGGVQHQIEEVAEQVQQFQFPVQFHGALGQTFALDEGAHVLLGGDDGPDEVAVDHAGREQRRASSSTSSISCVTSARRSTPSAAQPRTAPSSRDSALRCSPTASTSPSTAADPSPSCSRPTSAYTPPTCSKSLVASSGVTRPRAGPAPSSRGGSSASYCHPENKVSLSLTEGLNNKIRVLQRRAYGYREEDDLSLKIIAAFLHSLTRNAEKDPL